MVRLEVCVDTLAGLTAAVEGGADRIELCSRLDLGGLSPSTRLIDAARDCPRPVMVMIRPRAGHFCWSSSELSLCLEHIAVARSAGVAGVVLGAASRDGTLDRVALCAMLDAAHGLDTTLHRVVDETRSPVEAIEEAADLGFRRVLTSGGASTAESGLETLAAMIAAAPGVSVMPGAGVNPENAARIVTELGVREIHGSFSENGVTNAARIKATRAAISAL